MMSGFSRTFLLPLSSPLLKTEKKGISSQVALLSDDVNRRIYLKQEGRRHLQQIQTRTDSGWDFLDVQLTKRQYHQLLPQVRERKLDFAVYAVKTGNLCGYIRDFQGELRGLKMLSVNFRDAATAHSWTPDAEFLLGPEVTYHRNFGDYALITDSNGARNVPTETIHKKNNFVVGVIPYFPLSSGVELVIVQTRKKKRLIFPKGQPENNLSAAEVARLEAMEEAGIDGELTAHPILIPFKTHEPRHWLLYPMEVKSIHNEWKEKGLRNRSLVKLDAAIGNPSYLRLVPALNFLTNSLGTSHTATTAVGI